MWYKFQLSTNVFFSKASKGDETCLKQDASIIQIITTILAIHVQIRATSRFRCRGPNEACKKSKQCSSALVHLILPRLRVKAASVSAASEFPEGGGGGRKGWTIDADNRHHRLPPTGSTGSHTNGRVRQTESNLTRSDEWPLICEASNFAKVCRASIEGGHAFVPPPSQLGLFLDCSYWIRFNFSFGQAT